jgi:hypothetical protein
MSRPNQLPPCRQGDYPRLYRQNYEQRQREAGRGTLQARLSPAAHQQLRALREQYGCSTRDVLEGLLFGNIPAPNPLHLSPSEVECARALGVRL